MKTTPKWQKPHIAVTSKKSSTHRADQEGSRLLVCKNLCRQQSAWTHRL